MTSDEREISGETDTTETGKGLGARGLFAIAVTAVLVRLLFFMEQLNSPFFARPLLDQLYYHQFAVRLATGGDLSVFGGFRPMLYPLFLSIVYRVAGAGAGPMVAILVQHLLGAATTVLLADFAARFFRDARAGQPVLGELTHGDLNNVAPGPFRVLVPPGLVACPHGRLPQLTHANLFSLHALQQTDLTELTVWYKVHS